MLNPINLTIFFSYSATENTIKKMLRKLLEFLFTLLENQSSTVNFNYKRAIVALSKKNFKYLKYMRKFLIF